MKKRLFAYAVIFIFALIIVAIYLGKPEQSADDFSGQPNVSEHNQQLEVKQCEIPSAEKLSNNITASFNPRIKLGVKGIIFPDVLEWMGSREFSVKQENPECQKKLFAHAMDAPVRVGANWVGIVSSAFYKQVSPLPVIGPHNNDLSLTDEDYYAGLVGAAKERGLKIAQTESLTMGLGLSQEQIDAIKTSMENTEWWDEWFRQWELWLVPRAARAEKHGIDMLVIYLYPEDTFRADMYPQYGTKWEELISEVRKVYSGKIAINVINADERLTFNDSLDALLITVFDGLYTSRENGFADRKNPSMQELTALTEDFFYAPRELFGGKLPVYYVLTVTSTDGQEFSEEPDKRGKVDFNEQALYYEAFFRAMEDETWINGFFSERWDWFDQYKRPQEAVYYDQTGSSSPRNKPAENVVRAWYNST